ncbi:MAG: class I SAM-dependent methyltransferase [Armatimonadetes bacterium]|nr:class I SAM-dependent methyltransferase [Armatimonadota bacterium]
MNEKTNQFVDIAEHYDALMACVPYRRWVDYLESILSRLNYHPRTVLDLACGTGTVVEILYERGYDVTGVDVSPGMVEVARRKSEASDEAINYHVQDAAELSLGRKFDLVISLFDSLNYITDEFRLAQAIAKVGEHLVQGGYFIFDVNTEYALAHGFFNQSNLGSWPKYVWTSTYDRETRICTIQMAFEVLDHGVRRQFTEVHKQRAYSLEQIDTMIEDTGLETVQRYHAYKFKQPGRRSDRVFFVARKR